MKDKTIKVETVIKPGRFDILRILRWVTVAIIFLVLFSALDQLAHTLELFPGVVAWYPPDGVSLAFLLTFGAGFIPVFALASLFSSLFTYHFSTPFGPLLVWAVILSGVYGMEAVFLRRRVRMDPELRALRDTLWLILTSAVAATILALISVSALIHYGEVPAANYFNTYAEWWIGEMTGVVVFTPFLLIHGMPWVSRFINGELRNSIKQFGFRRPSLQTIGQVISIPIILYIVFGIPALASFEPFYLIAAPLIWIALKNGFSRVSLAIVGMNFGIMLAIWLFKYDTAHLGELQFLTLGVYASTLLTGAIVSKQKKTEEVLRQSEVRNRALIENAPDGITLLGADGQMKYSSPSTQRILGHSAEEFIGSDPAELIHPDDLPSRLKIMDDLSQTPGKVVKTQYRFRHKDGTWRWLESTLTNLLAEPSVQAIVINFRDITEQKQADETLQKSEKRFRALVEHSLEEISLIDPDGTLTYESPTMQRPLGYPPNSFVGYKLFDLFHPDERAAAVQLLEQIMKQPGSSQDALFRLRHQDGSWRWMEGVITNLLDEPAVQSIVINYHDITERKLAEQEIASMAKFPSENPNPVLRLGRDSNLLYANTASAALLQMWGSGVGEPVPQFWRELVSQALASMENKTVDVDCAGKVYSMFVTPVAETGYVDVYGRDVTEHKLAEAERNQSEALFRALFELSPDAIVLIDPHDPKVYWPIIDCNQAACQVNGYQRDELIGHTIEILNATPGTEAERIAYEKQLQEAGDLHYEILHRHKDGYVFPVEVSTALFTVEGRELVLGIDRDITARKQAETALQESENILRGFLEQSEDAIMMTNNQGMLIQWSKGAERLTGFSREESLGQPIWDIQFRSAPARFKSTENYENMKKGLQKALQTGKGKLLRNLQEAEIERPDGTNLTTQTLAFPVHTDKGFLIGSILRDVTERKQAEEAIRLSEEKYRTLVDEVNDGFYVTDEAGVFTFANSALARIYGVDSPQKLIGRKYSDFTAPDAGAESGEAYSSSMQTGHTPEVINGQIVRPDGTRAFVEFKPSMIVKNDKIVGSRGVVRDVTERKQAEEEIKTSNDELSMLFELSHTLAEANTQEDILDVVNRHAVESIHITFARIALLENGKFTWRAGYPIRTLGQDLGIGERNPVTSLPFTQRILEQNEPMIVRASDPGISNEEKKVLLLDFAQSVCLIPLRISDSARMSENLIGLLMLAEARNESREPFTQRKMRLAQTIGDSAAIALRRMLLREQTGRRLQQLTALSNIDRAISSTFDLQLSLGVLLQQVSAQLGVDATDVLLFNPNSFTLEYSAGRGFRTSPFEHAKLRLGEGYAGEAALKRETVHIANLALEHNNPRLEKHLADEQFVSYYGVPLIAKGEIKGVLEIFQRASLEPDEEWSAFLNTLAGQAAIAIDSVMQFDNVQRSNSELSQAYDETIQGWSHALDLRDNETEGHTQRVTELTMKLGHHFGLTNEELMQARRGALLHDIGKMGVPDGILLKPGPLTDEEWVIMKKHTTFAYEMLSPIHYLHAAIDIPYCHHEKWDGTGYPRGLRGEQIPLTARIFAVVDVWDALTSDRVYRAAWSKEKTREHIRSLAGTHFDAQVVKVCLESGLLEEK